MYFLTLSEVESALLRFREIQLNDSENGDSLFSKYGPGNIVNAVDKPHERFSDYENLLRTFWQDDPDKYKKIHKGTSLFQSKNRSLNKSRLKAALVDRPSLVAIQIIQRADHLTFQVFQYM